MNDLISMDNYTAIPSSYTLTIPEFGDLIIRDKTKNKNIAVKELAYVYFICDHRSPFSTYSRDIVSEKIITSIFKEIKWKPDSKIDAACTIYKKLTESSAVKLLKAARLSVNKLEKYFKEVDLMLLDDHDKPIYKASDLVGNLSKMGQVIEGLSKLEEQVKKEETINSNIRGNIQINKYSQ
jgi:hypothetical protein